LYEQFFRTAAAAVGSPLLELPKVATVDDLLALATQAAVEDLAAMATLLCQRLPDLMVQRATLNPTFDGSLAVEGADADLIVNHTLLELKTTKQDAFERVDHVYQLLGYALLDYSNEHEIERVGIYLARRGVLVSWSVAELLQACCVVKEWKSLQESFKKAVGTSYVRSAAATTSPTSTPRGHPASRSSTISSAQARSRCELRSDRSRPTG
jgi:hypothetical protein